MGASPMEDEAGGTEVVVLTVALGITLVLTSSKATLQVRIAT